MAQSLNDLGPRVASALVMAALALGAAYVGGHLFTLFWLIAAVAVLWEWQRMTAIPQPRLAFATGAIALAAAAGFSIMSVPEAAIGVIAASSLVCAFIVKAQRGWSAAGVVYAGALLISACTLRGSVLDGFSSILWLFAVVWGTDVMAYFCGRAIGGPKLWPRVSPSKTWSGFIGGVTCGALLGLAVSPIASQRLPVLIIGILTAMISQGGDLLESAIKRHFNVKDSSQLIPGHGGFMDRLDGFIAASVFACLVGALHRGPAEAASGLFRWRGGP